MRRILRKDYVPGEYTEKKGLLEKVREKLKLMDNCLDDQEISIVEEPCD